MKLALSMDEGRARVLVAFNTCVMRLRSIAGLISFKVRNSNGKRNLIHLNQPRHPSTKTETLLTRVLTVAFQNQNSISHLGPSYVFCCVSLFWGNIEIDFFAFSSFSMTRALIGREQIDSGDSSYDDVI